MTDSLSDHGGDVLVEDVSVAEGGPAGGAGGASWSGCRLGGHSVVTSATAARAEFSSTMVLSAANAATRAWTGRGRPSGEAPAMLVLFPDGPPPEPDVIVCDHPALLGDYSVVVAAGCR